MNVQKGDLAVIIESAMGLSVGKIVEVTAAIGEHSLLGPMWRCRSTKGELTTEYGATGAWVDMPDKWLKKIEDQLPDESSKEILEMAA